MFECIFVLEISFRQRFLTLSLFLKTTCIYIIFIFFAFYWMISYFFEKLVHFPDSLIFYFEVKVHQTENKYRKSINHDNRIHCCTYRKINSVNCLINLAFDKGNNIEIKSSKVIWINTRIAECLCNIIVEIIQLSVVIVQKSLLERINHSKSRHHILAL